MHAIAYRDAVDDTSLAVRPSLRSLLLHRGLLLERLTTQATARHVLNKPSQVCFIPFDDFVHESLRLYLQLDSRRLKLLQPQQCHERPRFPTPHNDVRIGLA
jgi:hypothetical protein